MAKFTVTNTGSASVQDITAWEDKSTNFTAVAFKGYRIDTSSAEIEMTLPSSPEISDRVSFMDYKRNFETNNFIIKQGGSKIMGASEDLTINVNNFNSSLIYTGADEGWVIL